jgi:hypothetical protein
MRLQRIAKAKRPWSTPRPSARTFSRKLAPETMRCAVVSNPYYLVTLAQRTSSKRPHWKSRNCAPKIQRNL